MSGVGIQYQLPCDELQKNETKSGDIWTQVKDRGQYTLRRQAGILVKIKTECLGI